MNLKPTFLYVFILVVCFSANSQIINKGALKVEGGTTIYFQDEYTNASTGNHVSDGNVYFNTSFINHGSTHAEGGTTYFKSETNKLLLLSGSSKKANFYNLEVDVSAPDRKGVLVREDFALQVTNSVNLVNGDLRLIGNAQLIQNHSGVSRNIGGSGKLLRDQSGHSSSFQYDYWSSPVSNGGTFELSSGKFDGSDADKNPFGPKQILFQSVKPYNGLPTIMDELGNVLKAMTINTRWLYIYSRGSGAYSEWIRINPSHKLTPGEGYIMKGPSSDLPTKNYVYYGTPNSGDYSFDIADKERILLGNPYPSELNAERFIEDNEGVIAQLEFWVDGGSPSHILSDYLGGYAAFNLTGGVPASIPADLINGIGNATAVAPPTKHMPVGKGFFVDAIGNGKIIFKNSQRYFEEEIEKDLANRNSVDAYEKKQYIRLGFEGPEGFHRQLLLGFLPDSPADMNFNSGYDATQIGTRKDDMFFIIENDASKRYTIQGVNRFSDEMEFPIGLLISQVGSHKIMVDDLKNFNGVIYLKDKFLNSTHALTDSMVQMSLLPGEYVDRYSIVFKPTTTLGTSDSALDKTLIYYNGRDQIVISNSAQLQINSVNVYSVLGQHVLTFSPKINNQSKIVIPFKESQGVYMVVINTNMSKKSVKIIKY